MKLVIASGGTGGHIIPALSIALAWQELGREVVWFGRKDSLEEKMAKEHGIPFVQINAYGLSPLKKLPKNLYQISKNIHYAAKLLKEQKASCVFSTGSYASFPTAMASVVANIPLVLHEQNTVMGLANKVLMPFAKRVYLGMQVEGLPKNWIVGNPIRIKPRVNGDQNHILVFAGSQGAAFLNDNIPKVLAKLGCQLPVIHISGSNRKVVEKAYNQYKINAVVHDFLYDMDTAYQKAKIVICRSGAMSLAEITAYQIPGIVIPYPHARHDHQKKNAQYAMMNGGVSMVLENAEDTQALEVALEQLLYDQQKWILMKKRLQENQYQDAREKIVKGMIELCEKSLSH